MEQGKAGRLKRKILDDAEAEARRLVKEGEAEAQHIREQARKEADGIISTFAATARAEAEEHIRRQVSLRELEARKAVLGQKGRVIEEVFDRALGSLRERDRQSGYALTRGLLVKAVETGTEEIIMAPEDRRVMDTSFLDGLNAELRGAGKVGEVKLSEETRNLRGGFVLRRGRVEINSSFETLLAMLRDEIEGKVAGILFSESKDTT